MGGQERQSPKHFERPTSNQPTTSFEPFSLQAIQFSTTTPTTTTYTYNGRQSRLCFFPNFVDFFSKRLSRVHDDILIKGSDNDNHNDNNNDDKDNDNII